MLITLLTRFYPLHHSHDFGDQAFPILNRYHEKAETGKAYLQGYIIIIVDVTAGCVTVCIDTHVLSFAVVGVILGAVVTLLIAVIVVVTNKRHCKCRPMHDTSL